MFSRGSKGNIGQKSNNHTRWSMLDFALITNLKIRSSLMLQLNPNFVETEKTERKKHTFVSA